jgi:hypothetical protein
MVEVTAKTEEGAEVTFDYEFGSNYVEAAEIFGGEIVWNYALRALTIAAQGHARSMIRAGKTADEIKTTMETWKPGMPRLSRSPEEKIKALLDKLTPEERENLALEIRAAREDEDQPAAAKKAKRA